MRNPYALVFSLATAVVAACTCPQPEPVAPLPPPPPAPVASPPPAPAVEASNPAEPAAEATPPAPVPWEDKTAEQKAENMKQVVLPRMTATFQTHDAKAFAQVNCKTCHGKGAELGSFKMPNADLPKLNPANGFAEAKKKKAAMVEFMMKDVTPQMASLLDMQPYDPATQQGFGCFACHPMKQ